MPIRRADSARSNRATAVLSKDLAGLVDAKPHIADPAHASSDTIDFDVVIVGSGYGGAVAAAELAGCKDGSREISICVLERGKEYLSGSFPDRLADLPGHLRYTREGAQRQEGVHDGLYDVRLGGDAVAVMASGLGGGSLVNAGVMAMPNKSVFEESRWPTEIRTKSKSVFDTAKALEPWLGARALPKSQWTERTRLLEKLAPPETFKAVKIQVASPRTNQTSAGFPVDPCCGCGDCAVGCNYDAKLSLDTSLLAYAARIDGVSIYTGATVYRVAPRDDGAWSLQLNHTDRYLCDRQRRPFVLNAGKVILAAGTFGSTEILMRSQTKDGTFGGAQFSNRLGKKWSANGDLMALAYDLQLPDGAAVNGVADECRAPGQRQVGPTITGMIDLRTGDPDSDVVIQDLAVPGPLHHLFQESVTMSDVVNQLAAGDFTEHFEGASVKQEAAVRPDAINRSLLVAMIGRDDADGELHLVDETALCGKGSGLLSVKWPNLRFDPRFDKHHQRLECLLDKAGLKGRVVTNMMWRPLSDDLERIFGSQRGPLVTVHPLGGCAMGNSPLDGVTDHCGRVFFAKPVRVESGEGGDGRPTTKSGPNDRPQSSNPACYYGLAVLDGSIVPTSLGINPALTIAALAARAMPTLKEDWGFTGQSALAKPPESETRGRRLRYRERDRPNPRPAPGATKLELTEQVRGPINLRGDMSIGNPYVAELTLVTRPTSVGHLIAEHRHGSDREFLLSDGRDKTRPSRLRILKGERDPVSDDWSEVVLDADLSGKIKLFGLEPSRPLTRIARAVWAWARNRGIRDVSLSLIKRFLRRLRYEPPVESRGDGLWNYVKTLVTSMIKLCSLAGAVRTIEYDLTITKVHSPRVLNTRSAANKSPGGSGGGSDAGKTPEFNPALFEGKSIRGIKRLTYSRASSAYQQLSEIVVERFPEMTTGMARKKPILELNQRYLARQKVPLVRIVEQEDHISGLMDLLSFGLYSIRVILQAHALSLRKPDRPSTRPPQRFVTAIPGRLPTPEISWIGSDTSNTYNKNYPTARARLSRYRGRDAPEGTPNRPVLLIHGYSVSGTIFAHEAVPGNLAETLYKAGRDVWIIDMRSSSALPTATAPWPFEAMATNDIPNAIRHIHRVTNKKIDVVAHCMGAAMYSMAILGKQSQLDGAPLHELIGRTVFSQVGPVMVLSPANVLRGYVMRFVREIITMGDYTFSPQEETTVAGQIFDRALAAFPLPKDEYRRENPIWPPGKVTPWVGSRHRMDALYARTFALNNLSDEVLDKFEDFFGPLSIETVSQGIHFAANNSITDSRGHNAYVNKIKLRQRFRFPIFSIHGEVNGLIDPATLTLMRRALKHAGITYLNPVEALRKTGDKSLPPEVDRSEPTTVPMTPAAMKKVVESVADQIDQDSCSYLTWLIPGHGHLDCLMGKHAGAIAEVVRDYLCIRDSGKGPACVDPPEPGQHGGGTRP